MRIGIFGGTFDPPHLGHLILAERCREEAELDQVWFLPSYVPPHKTDRPLTRFEHRCEMVALATAGQPAFRVDGIEKELPPPSYTAETLRELHERHPNHEFHLLLGADSLVDLPTWYEPQRVIERAGLIVVPRQQNASSHRKSTVTLSRAPKSATTCSSFGCVRSSFLRPSETTRSYSGAASNRSSRLRPIKPLAPAIRAVDMPEP